MSDNDLDHAFDQIWTVQPDRHNRFSSAWWFFYLFPEGDEGYGPEQLMVAVMANKNKLSEFNGLETEPMNLSREDGKEKFNSVINSWYSNKEELIEIVKDTSKTELSPKGRLEAFNKPASAGKNLVIESRSDERDGFQVHLKNSHYTLDFETFNNSNEKGQWPKENYNLDKLGLGANLINWTRMNFKGELKINGVKKDITGAAYFQRVCLHIPLMPWKWLYTVFPIGDVFIGFIPYLGLQHIRRTYKFSSKNHIEDLTWPIKTVGKWIKAETGEIIEFDKVTIKTLLHDNDAPNFEIKAIKDEGAIKFTAHTEKDIKNVMKKPVLAGLTENRYFYNEYIFSVEDFESTLNEIELNQPENGYGNFEYTWGQWL